MEKDEEFHVNRLSLTCLWNVHREMSEQQISRSGIRELVLGHSHTLGIHEWIGDVYSRGTGWDHQGNECCWRRSLGTPISETEDTRTQQNPGSRRKPPGEHGDLKRKWRVSWRWEWSAASDGTEDPTKMQMWPFYCSPDEQWSSVTNKSGKIKSSVGVGAEGN